MQPREFKEAWKITNGELAQLLGYSVDGVNHWFRKEKPAEVPSSVEAQLDQWHAQFLSWKAEDEHLPIQAREIYQAAILRQKPSI